MRAILDHFEIPVADSDLVASFLEAVFGWVKDRSDSVKGQRGSECMDSPGMRYRRLVAAEAVAGAIGPSMRVGLYEGPSGTLDRAMPVVRVTGEALEALLARVTEAGGRVVLEPEDVGHSGRFARCEDPEGNPWGLWEPAAGPTRS